MTKAFVLRNGANTYSFTPREKITFNGKLRIKWTLHGEAPQGNGVWVFDKWCALPARATRTEVAEAFGIKPRQVIININEKLGDMVDFRSMAEYRRAIKASGYKLPSDGLVEGRDYECWLEEE